MKKWICCLGVVCLAGASAAKPVAVLELNANISSWMDYYSDTAGTNETYAALTALGVSNVAVSVQVDKGLVIAFAKVETSLPDARTTWLSHTNLIQLEPVEGDEFRWVPENKKDLESRLIPTEHIHFHFSGSTVFISDETHSSFAETLEVKETGALYCSIRLAPLLDPFFNVVEKLIADQEEGFGKAIMSSMLESLRQSSQSIADMPSVSIEIEALDSDIRRMNLMMDYQAVDAARGIQVFFADSADAWKNPNLSEKQLGLIELVDTPYFQEVKLNGSTLQFVYEWPAAKDAELVEMIGEATIGNLFSFSDPSSFPVHPEETMDPPSLANVAEFDAAGFEKNVRSALFFNHSWSSHVDLTVDYLDIPNVDLVAATVSNVCVLATNGVNITKQERSGSFRFDSAKGSASISLKREKDGPPAKTVSFTLKLNVPTEIEQYTLTRQSPLVETDEGGCFLIAMSNSVISLRSKGLSLREAKIYALNSDGKYLNRKGASWSDSTYRAEYKGTPDKVELVWPVKTESISLDFKNLAVGKDDKLKMPSNPTNNVVTRYTLETLKIYSDPDMDAISASSMTMVTNAGWKKNEYYLRFPKPEGVETDSRSLKSYFAGVNELVGPGQKSGGSSSGGFFTWQITQTNVLASATAVFGEVKGSFWSDVGYYTANVSTNPTPLISERELPTAWVEHNVVWVEHEKNGKVLDVQAFDKTGRRLKKDNRTRSSNAKRGYYFWGIPGRATVAYASSKEDAVLPFQIELKEGGLADIAELQTDAEQFENVLDLVKEIDKKARRSLGALLSAHYYFCNSEKEPSAAIPLEVAHSDPAGVPIFGYELKPYNGYYFRKILTESELERSSKPSSYSWAGGTFESGSDSGVLMATPADPKAPAILMIWNNVYVNYGNCSSLKSIPTSQNDLETAGWIKVE